MDRVEIRFGISSHLLKERRKRTVKVQDLGTQNPLRARV